MNNEDLRGSIIQKWQPIVKEICKGFNPEDINRVCEFAHNFVLAEASQQESYENLNTIIREHNNKFNLSAYNAPEKSLLEINLKAISMIIDIAQVTFMPMPIFVDTQFIKETDEDGIIVLRKKQKVIQVGTVIHKVKIDRDLLAEQYLRHNIGEEIKSCIAETVSNKINTQISLGNKVYLYQPIQLITQKSNRDLDADINESESGYVTFEIYSRCAYIEPGISLTNISNKDETNHHPFI